MFVDNLTQSEPSGTLETPVHYVPFNIAYDGKANVATKFSSKAVSVNTPDHNDGSDSCEQAVLENQFRGKPLMGKMIQLPDNYKGVVATDLSVSTKKTDSNDSKKDVTLRIDKEFSCLTYWNWDKPPSSMDAPVKLMDWLRLSQVLHDPIENEDAC